MIVVWVGIDVSKKNLDAAISELSGKYRTRRVSNTPKGFAELEAWARKAAGSGVQLKFCMESTGDYGIELALQLSEQNYDVSVVNPAQVKYYGIYKGRINKTDKTDSRLIADFAKDSNPEPWPLKDPNRRDLFRLNRRRHQLVKMETAEMNRRECPKAIGSACMASIKTVLKAIRSELRIIEKQIALFVESVPEFKAAQELITSLPPLAAGSAVLIIAEMPPVKSAKDAKSWAAASGAHSTTRQSGTSVQGSGRISKRGRKQVRGQLFMPTLTGLGSMPELRNLYDRLIARGKTHHQALVACLRKLLMIVYGVLKHQQPYKPRSQENSAPA